MAIGNGSGRDLDGLNIPLDTKITQEPHQSSFREDLNLSFDSVECLEVHGHGCTILLKEAYAFPFKVLFL